MLNDLGRAFGQLDDPAILRVLGLSAGIAALILIGLATSIGAGFSWLTAFNWGWLDLTIDVLAALGGVVLALALFPATAVAISALFLDRVAEAVERRHYPALPPVREQSLWAALWLGLRFFVVYLLANLFALGLTLLLPGINVIVWLLVNGYLLGREYYEMVAVRRLDERAVRAAFGAHWLKILGAGMVIAVLFTIPFLNLLAPVVATAFMVHRFQNVMENHSGSA